MSQKFIKSKNNNLRSTAYGKYFVDSSIIHADNLFLGTHARQKKERFSLFCARKIVTLHP